jgi:hypothetical protein
MAVVINEFEVLPESQPETRKPASGAKTENDAPKTVEPGALASALRVLETRALRAWSH